MDGWRAGWMEGWMDGSMDGRVKEDEKEATMYQKQGSKERGREKEISYSFKVIKSFSKY